MKYTGYRGLARMLVGCCEAGEIVSSDDIAETFKVGPDPLPYSAVRKIKSEARKIALKRGVYWSYDPLVKGYRVCPAGDRETADRMSAFDVRSANGALGAARMGWRARSAAKLATRKETELRVSEIGAIMTEVEMLAKEIEK